MSDLRPLPTIATKAKIFEMYFKLPERTVREAINYAIERVNEESSIQQSKYIKTLNNRHITIIIEELGDAPGYESSYVERKTFMAWLKQFPMNKPSEI